MTRPKPGVTQIAITALSAQLISNDFIWFLRGPAGVRVVGGGSTLAVAAKSYCNGGSSLSGGAITARDTHLISGKTMFVKLSGARQIANRQRQMIDTTAGHDSAPLKY